MLTYMMVTVLALLSLEIVIVIIIFVFSQATNANTLGYLSDVVSTLAPQARPYLNAGASNLDGLQNWLQSIYDSGYASLPPQDFLDNPAASIVKTEPMYAISPDEIILAAAPLSARSSIGSKYTPPADIARSQDILESALQLDLQSGHISALTPDGNYLIAVPVRQSPAEGPILAVIILTVKAPPSQMSAWWPVFLGIVPVTGFILLLAVAPFGALFGFIMSRSLTRRLKDLTVAADAWSEGDFSIRPQDHSMDEIGYLGVRLHRMAEYLQMLLHTKQELAHMEERNRLARDLHDTVKQETFATLMQVRAAKNLLDRDLSSAREHLNQAEALIKNSQQELGLIISELRPAALEGKGLADALRDYLTTWSQHARIPVDIQVQNERHLTLEVEQTLFRIAQEALSNVVRHSRASAVTIRLAFDSDRVILCITDNGIGFDPSAFGSGFGFQSMYDRVVAIHGHMSVQAAPDNGVTITVNIPTIHKEQS